jgi:phosphate transport system protein
MAEPRRIHSRAALDDGLVALQQDLRTLASLLDLAIERSMLALEHLDRQLAEKVIRDDAEINELRYASEERAIELIARQQPLAGDLRLIIAALTAVSELERMGDYCAGIARVALLHGDRPLLKPLVDMPRMASVVRDLLRDAIDAFIARDADAAEKVAKRDDEVDVLYEHIYGELLTYMLAEPRTIEPGLDLILVSRHLERVGDHATNIAETLYFAVNGTTLNQARPKRDQTNSAIVRPGPTVLGREGG